MKNILILLIISSYSLFSDEIYRPNSVTYNETSETYIVSSLGKADGVTKYGLISDAVLDPNLMGYIYAYNQMDNTFTKIFYADDDNKRMVIKNDNLYICGIDRIIEIDISGQNKKSKLLKTNKNQRKKRIGKKTKLKISGLFHSNNNKLFTIDNNGYLLEYNSNKGMFKKYKDIKLNIKKIHDACYLKKENMIIISTMDKENPLYFYDLKNDQYNKIPFERIDIGRIYGITSDDKGNIYMSGWDNGKIFKYNISNNELTVVSEDHKGPALLFYNKIKEELVVPNMYDNSISILKL